MSYERLRKVPPLLEDFLSRCKQGGRLWVVSFSLLALSYFRVLFLLPGN